MNFSHTRSQFMITLGCLALVAAVDTPCVHSKEAKPPANPVAYSQGPRVRAFCHHCRSDQCQCELVCCPRPITGTETKSYWKVTRELVCIPGFRFPWECWRGKDGKSHGLLVCGPVREVNVLDEVEYQCEICGYQWEIKCVRRSDEATSKHCQCPRCARQEPHLPQRMRRQ